VKLFGQKKSHELLKGFLFGFLDDQSMNVVDAILGNIDVIIDILCPDEKSGQATEFINAYFSKLLALHGKIKAKSWRVETKFVTKLSCLLNFVNEERMRSVLLPIFKTVLLTSPPECKAEVCDLLSQILTGFCQNPMRLEIHSLIKSLAVSPSCHDRQTFLLFIQVLLNRMSKHYFKDYFLLQTLALGDDRVVGVKMKFCAIACDIKQNLLKEDIKSSDRLFALIDGIIKKTTCKSLKEVCRVIINSFRVES